MVFVVILVSLLFNYGLLELRFNLRSIMHRLLFNHSDDILLFVHLHKAAGTAVVSRFKNSAKYIAFPLNKNGNPHTYISSNISQYCKEKYSIIDEFDTNKCTYYTYAKLFVGADEYKCFNKEFEHTIKFDLYNKTRFITFIKELKHGNVNFLANEFSFWSFNNYINIIQPFNYLKIFTILRHPFKRFISNYEWFHTRRENTFKRLNNLHIDMSILYQLCDKSQRTKQILRRFLLSYYFIIDINTMANNQVTMDLNRHHR